MMESTPEAIWMAFAAGACLSVVLLYVSWRAAENPWFEVPVEPYGEDR